MTKVQFSYHFYFRNELKTAAFADSVDRYLGHATFSTMEDPPGPLVLETFLVQRVLLEAILKEYYNGTPVFRLLAPDGSYVDLDTANDFSLRRFQMELKKAKVSEGGSEPSALMTYALQSQDQFQIAFTSGALPEILETTYDITGSQRALRAATNSETLLVIAGLVAMLALFWFVTQSKAPCGEASAYMPYEGPPSATGGAAATRSVGMKGLMGGSAADATKSTGAATFKRHWL